MTPQFMRRTGITTGLRFMCKHYHITKYLYLIKMTETILIIQTFV